MHFKSISTRCIYFTELTLKNDFSGATSWDLEIQYVWLYLFLFIIYTVNGVHVFIGSFYQLIYSTTHCKKSYSGFLFAFPMQLYTRP